MLLNYLKDDGINNTNNYNNKNVNQKRVEKVLSKVICTWHSYKQNFFNLFLLFLICNNFYFNENY